MQEVNITHLCRARREIVFKAWTTPEYLALWWGPHGFTNPLVQLDLRPGGRIRIDMTTPDGQVFPMLGTFKEIVEPERLVFTSGPDDGSGNLMFEAHNTITFTEQKGGTLITVVSKVLWANPGSEQHLQGMIHGWGQTLEKLEQFVSGLVETKMAAEVAS